MPLILVEDKSLLIKSIIEELYNDIRDVTRQDKIKHQSRIPNSKSRMGRPLWAVIIRGGFTEKARLQLIDHRSEKRISALLGPSSFLQS